MASRPERVASFCTITGTDNIVHAIEVSADTLYEAAVLALAEFRKGCLVDVLPRIASTCPADRHLTSVGAAPVNIHIHAMDAGSFDDYLHANSVSLTEAVAAGMSTAPNRLTAAIRTATGQS